MDTCTLYLGYEYRMVPTSRAKNKVGAWGVTRVSRSAVSPVSTLCARACRVRPCPRDNCAVRGDVALDKLYH